MAERYRYLISSGSGGRTLVSGAAADAPDLPGADVVEAGVATAEPGVAARGRLVIDLPPSLDPRELYIASELAKSALLMPMLTAALRVEHESILEAAIPILCLHPATDGTAALPLVLFAHGFETAKEKLIRYALRLAAGGCMVVLMDAPLHGERMERNLFRELYDFGSDPGAAWDNRLQLMREYYDELIAILELFLKDGRVDPDRVGVAGISMGASVALRAAARDPRVRSVAAFVPVLDFESLPDLPAGDFAPARGGAEARDYDPLYFFREAPTASILVQCGAEDEVVGKLAGRKLDLRLSSLRSGSGSSGGAEGHAEGKGARYQFREYPGLGHELSAEMVDAAIQWFRETLAFA